MNIFVRPKGHITSRFSAKEPHRDRIHAGIDFKSGFKVPQWAIADALVYDVLNKDSSDLQQYRNIKTIAETPLGPVEITYVHCWDIWVSPGNQVFAGQPIYTEGNTGSLVYSGGILVKPEEKPSGKGSHSHIQARPLVRVSKMVSGEHYARKYNGEAIQDKNGNYFRVSQKDNGAKGCIDWEPYMYTPPAKVLLVQYTRILGYLSKLLTNK